MKPKILKSYIFTFYDENGEIRLRRHLTTDGLVDYIDEHPDIDIIAIVRDDFPLFDDFDD